jgi:F-type H+-transporting ATPase subunit delta
MAELSTIARPYAVALFDAAKGGTTGNNNAPAWLPVIEELAQVAAHPQVASVVADPKLGAKGVASLITGLMKSKLPNELTTFLATLIDNQRLAALPEIARQFRALKNAAEGVADCMIESAFALNDSQVADLVGAMSKKFGLKLKPDVRVDASLIGGVRVSVGDHVLDTSVKTQLAQMQAALTAA